MDDKVLLQIVDKFVEVESRRVEVESRRVEVENKRIEASIRNTMTLSAAGLCLALSIAFGTTFLHAGTGNLSQVLADFSHKC